MSRFEQVEALFHEARTLAPDTDRMVWLETHCAGDRELLEEVRSLLDAHVDMSHAAPVRSAAEVPTAHFGAYRAVELLGRGGMSTVYRAERADGQFDQTVALKIMAAYLNGTEFLRRFQTERQLLASLNHVNITHLLDGGVSSAGDPYLITEFVEGQCIDSYCDQELLDVRGRLRIFLQVCEAVDYAHRNLIVHRDLKPGNILVNTAGVVKLLDFGTASLTATADADVVTRVHMLTPRYASPEQLRGERVNTSTDVFSLGVVLYELLCGAWPFGDPIAVWSGLNRATEDVAPKAPSTVITTESAERRGASAEQLRRLLKGDLSPIVLKALEYDPVRRYESVRQFASDIENYLEGRPVQARPQTVVYRARKFLRRHWLPVTAASVFTLALAAMAGVAFYQANVARREALKSETTSKFLQDMLAADNSVDKDITLRAMVDRAETKLNRAKIADPLVEADLRMWLAQSYLNRQEFEKMDHELDRAEMLYRAAGHWDDLATVESYRAGRFDFAGNRKGARPHLDEALRICRKRDTHADAGVCINTYLDLIITHTPEFTADEQRTFLAEAESVLRRHPELPPEFRSKILKGKSRVALRQRRVSDAKGYLEEALRIDRAQPDPDDGAIAQDLFILADVTFHAGDLASAVDYHRQRMDLFARASGPDASITQHATSNLAIVLAYQGNLQEARRLADQAFQKTRNVVPYLRMTPLYVSALARNMQGQPKEAEPFARDALEICEKSYAKTTSVYADYLAELGISQLLQGRAKEALPGLETADQIWSKLRRVNDPAVERVHKYYLLAKTAP